MIIGVTFLAAALGICAFIYTRKPESQAEQ